jgi:hypothetical protein
MPISPMCMHLSSCKKMKRREPYYCSHIMIWGKHFHFVRKVWIFEQEIGYGCLSTDELVGICKADPNRDINCNEKYGHYNLPKEYL